MKYAPFSISINCLAALGGLTLFSSAWAGSNAITECKGNLNLKGAKVSGGETGAFIREMSQKGVRMIQSCLNIPPAEDLWAFSFPEQKKFFVTRDGKAWAERRDPYIYFGFNAPGLNVEAGLAFQYGGIYDKNPAFIPYMRANGGEMVFSDRADAGIRYEGGDRLCMTAEYRNGKFAFTYQGKSKADQSGGMDVNVRVSANQLSELRARRVTEITTSLQPPNTPPSPDGLDVGFSVDHSFTDGIELGGNRIRVTWENSLIEFQDLRQEPFSQVIDWEAKNSGGRCDGSVRWPATLVVATDDGLYSETREIHGPSAPPLAPTMPPQTQAPQTQAPAALVTPPPSDNPAEQAPVTPITPPPSGNPAEQAPPALPPGPTPVQTPN